LDLNTGDEIIGLLDEMKRSLGITIITATHDMKMLSASDVVVTIRGGEIDNVATKDELNITIGSIDGETVMKE
jgi:putative ABC transport system ATP-binding protein